MASFGVISSTGAFPLFIFSMALYSVTKFPNLRAGFACESRADAVFWQDGITAVIP